MMAAVVLSLSGCRTAKDAVSETVERADTVRVVTHDKSVRDSVSERHFDRTSDSIVEKVHEIIELDSAGKVISHKIDKVHETYQAQGSAKATSRDSTGKKSVARADTIAVSHTDTIDKPPVTKTVKCIPKAYKVAMWFMVIIIIAGVVYIVFRFGLIAKIKGIIDKIKKV